MYRGCHFWYLGPHDISARIQVSSALQSTGFSTLMLVTMFVLSVRQCSSSSTTTEATWPKSGYQLSCATLIDDYGTLPYSPLHCWLLNCSMWYFILICMIRNNFLSLQPAKCHAVIPKITPPAQPAWYSPYLCKLSWSQHLSQGLLYRKFYKSSTMLQLYVSFIDLILSTCSAVWDPYLIKNVEILERSV